MQGSYNLAKRGYEIVGMLIQAFFFFFFGQIALQNNPWRQNLAHPWKMKLGSNHH